jgi:hypothetical protein
MFKIIIKGRLDFGSPRGFEQVLKEFNRYVEGQYRFELLFKTIEIFNMEEMYLEIPLLVKETSDKYWKNTINLIENLAQFAVAGRVVYSITSLEKGIIIKQDVIEPTKMDKTIIKEFIEGRELVKEETAAQAIAPLTNAIGRYSRHLWAYERRGSAHLLLNDTAAALSDFESSIACAPNADAYLGRAIIAMFGGDYATATADAELALRNSAPLMAVHWKARRIKGESHNALGEFSKAAFELNIVAKRTFSPADSNYQWRRSAYYQLGLALTGTGEYAKAIDAFNLSSNIEEGRDKTPKADHFYRRGLARKKSGKSDYIADIKKAAELGSTEAKTMISELPQRGSK